MQLARQTAFKSEKPAPSKKDNRARTIAAIHITWKKLRPDLRHDKDELRESRLQFMSTVLNRDIKSSRDLTLSKLGKVLDAMRKLEVEPLLPGGAPTVDREQQTATDNVEIHHLATEAQCAAINKLFLHLGWTLETIEGFTEKRFKRKSHRMLTPEKANSLTMILLTIAANRDIKRRWLAETGREVEKVSREMIRAEIPALKRRLGVDQAGKDACAPEEEEADYDMEH